MAYASDTTDQDQDNSPEAQAARQAATNPTTSSGGGLFGVPGSSSASGASASGANPAPTASSSNTGYTNLNAYLTANQPQAQAMGEQVAGAVGDQAKQATQDVNNLTQNWNQEVGANTVAPSNINQTLSDAANGKTNTPEWNQEAAAFSNQLNAAGNAVPQDFTTQSGYGGASNAISNAQNALNATQSEAGRNTLLQQQYGNGKQYNQGENSLDQALIETNPNAANAISGVKSQWSGINGILGQATQAGDTQAANAVATNKAASDAAQQALTAANTSFNTNIGSAVAGANTNRGIDYNQAVQDLNNNTLTPAEMSEFGLTPGEHIYDMSNLSQYLAPQNTATINAAQVATPEDFAASAALSQLGGAGAATNALSGYTAPATAPVLSPTFDLGKFTADQNTAAQGYGNAVSNWQHQLESAMLPQYGSSYSGMTPEQAYAALQTFGKDVYGIPATGATVPGAPAAGVIAGGTGATGAKARFDLGNALTGGLSGAASGVNGLGNALTGGIAGDLTNGPGQTATLTSSVPESEVQSLLNAYAGFGKQFGQNNVLSGAPLPSGAANADVAAQSAQGPAFTVPGIQSQPAPASTSPAVPPSLIGGFAQGGLVSSNPWSRIHSMLGHAPGDQIQAPPKEPHAPKLPHPDVKLPTMPHFAYGGSPVVPGEHEGLMAEGGEPPVIESDARALADGGGVLDANARAHIAPKNFAEPGARKYPIHDEAHARNALARVAQFGSPHEQEVVRRQVHAKYPSLAGNAEHNEDHLKNFLDGGKVGGRAPDGVHKGENSYDADVVPAMLSPKEIVLPRKVTQSSHPVEASAEFVKKELYKKKK